MVHHFNHLAESESARCEGPIQASRGELRSPLRSWHCWTPRLSTTRRRAIGAAKGRQRRQPRGYLPLKERPGPDRSQSLQDVDERGAGPSCASPAGQTGGSGCRLRWPQSRRPMNLWTWTKRSSTCGIWWIATRPPRSVSSGLKREQARQIVGVTTFVDREHNWEVK